MKKDIHPDYVDCTVTCTCGNTFQTRSTKPELRVDICNACHPFFTGTQKLIDSGGRVQRFANKFGTATETVAAREAAKKAERAAEVEAMEAAKKADREVRLLLRLSVLLNTQRRLLLRKPPRQTKKLLPKRLMKLRSRLRKKLLSKRLSKLTKQRMQPRHLQRRALNSRPFVCSAPKNISLRQHFRKRSEKEESRTLGALFLFVSRVLVLCIRVSRYPTKGLRLFGSFW